MKKLFSIFAALLFAGSIMAAEITFTAGTDTSDGTSITKDGITISVTSGTFSRTDNYRCYANNTMTISSTVGIITKIEFTFSGTSNTGGWDAEYEPNAESWTSPSASGQARLNKIVVTTGAAPAVSTPVISGKEAFITETTVSIACSTVGASIYYTTNGTDPTSSSTLYEAAFPLTASATVKAIAIKGSDVSTIASKEFTKVPVVTCADANGLAKDAVAALNEVTVTYVNGAYIYVKDVTGSTLVYAFDYGLKAGDVVSGILGVASPYNGLPELKPSVTKDELTITAGTAPAPEEFSAAPVAADVNKYIIMKNVSVATGSFTTSSATNLNLTIGEQTVVLRNNFKLEATFDASKKYNVVGAVAIYNSTIQVYFISAEEVTATPAPEIEISETAIDFGTVEVGAKGPDDNAYLQETFTLTGTNLTGDVRIEATTTGGGSIFTTNGYRAVATLSPTDGAINSTIYAIAATGFAGTFNGLLTISSDAGDFENFTVALSIVVVEPTKYYLKNNWGGGEWTWQQTTKVSDNEYKLENVVFGGTGVNVNTAESDEGSSWIAHESFNGNPIKALDTVTLTYVVSSNSISAILLGSYVAPVDNIYTAAGSSAAIFGTTWDPTVAANDLVLKEGTIYEKVYTNVTLAEGTVSFKVCVNHAWTTAYPASDYNLIIPEDGIYTITITFDASTSTVSATAEKTGSAVVIPTIVMHGTFGATWADTEEFALAADEKTASLTLALEAKDIEFGVKVDGAWTANGATLTREAPSTSLATGNGNMHLVADVAGDYVFTWTYETNTLSVEFPVIPEYNIYIADGIEHGEISASVGSAAVGETVTVTITPDEGYELDELTATGGELEFNVAEDKKSATFVMPGRELTISATFKEVAAATKYCEFPTGHQNNADFGDANGRILLTIQKIEGSNNLRVAVKNNNANGNTKTGLNFLWVNATNATNNNATYGSHDAEDVEEVSVIVEFDAAQDSYNFVNIHWAYSGWGGEWAIDGLTVLASELCEAGPAVAIDNTELKVKAVKTIENGMLIIEHNGVRYNAQGQVVR